MAAVPITNTLFPPPPGYYKAFTSEAVARHAALRGEEPEEAAAPGELDDLTGALEPPRADWVLEEGQWMLFGQKYTVSRRVSWAWVLELQLVPPLGHRLCSSLCLLNFPHRSCPFHRSSPPPTSLPYVPIAAFDLIPPLLTPGRTPRPKCKGHRPPGPRVRPRLRWRRLRTRRPPHPPPLVPAHPSRLCRRANWHEPRPRRARGLRPAEPGRPGELAECASSRQYIQHLSNLAATMMVSANQLRGVQVSPTQH